MYCFTGTILMSLSSLEVFLKYTFKTICVFVCYKASCVCEFVHGSM